MGRKGRQVPKREANGHGQCAEEARRLRSLGFGKPVSRWEGVLCAVCSLLLEAAGEHLNVRFTPEKLRQRCPSCNNMLD